MPDFPDTQNHWARSCIEQLAQRSIVGGYPDGQFRPDGLLTRAEFAVMVQRAFPQAAPVRAAINFVDIPRDYWALSAIQAVYRAGFLSGYPGQVFHPIQQIPRVQVLVALIAGLQYRATRTIQPTLVRYFDDAARIPAYATGAIVAAIEAFLIVNYPYVRLLQPTRNATRAEVAALLCRALQLPGVPLPYIAGLDFIVIHPRFEQADAFTNGLARVKVGNTWGYINPQGQMAIASRFQQAESFSDGLGLVRQPVPLAAAPTTSSPSHPAPPTLP